MFPTRRFLTVAGCFCVSLLGGCQCSSEIDPLAPPRIPPPEIARSIERSTVFIPVEIPITEVAALVNAAVPDTLYSVRDEQIKGGIFPVKMDLDITRNGSIRSLTQRGFIENRIPVQAVGRIRIPPGVWRPFSAEFTVDAVTKLTLNEDWTTVAETSGDFRWQEAPYITILGIKIGLEGKAENALRDQLIQLAPTIDGMIEEKINLRKEADKIWESIGEPIQVRSDPTGWLLIRPIGTFFTEGVSQSDTFVVGLNIEAELETVLGERPGHLLLDSLPPLIPLPDSLADAAHQEFQMHVPVTITYDQAQDLLTRSIGRKDLQVQGNVTVNIERVALYPSESSVIARLDFRANLVDSRMVTAGTVYLKGLPRYNILSQTVSIDSLEYDLNSSDALATAADWLFHGTFVDLTRDKLQFPLTGEIVLVIEQITDALRGRALGKHIVLDATIHEFIPAEIYLTEEGINVDVFVRGTMVARVRGLGEVM